MTTAQAEPQPGTAPVPAAPPAEPARTAAEEIVVTNPATGDEIGRVPVLSAAEVRGAVDRARAAQRAWGALTVEQRCTRLRPVQQLLLERSDEIADALVRESGKTRTEAFSMEIIPSLELTATYLRRAPRALAPQKVPMRLAKHRVSYVHYVPRGVMGIISPWNFPFSLPYTEALFGLLAGNAVVIKPSEVTPLVAERVRALFKDAGLDGDLVSVVTGRGATGAALIESGVNQVTFTGSVATGRRVGEACARLLIPCTLELGGKAAALVCHDANLDRAVQCVTWGAFGNAGQVCASVERVYVDARVYDEFKDRVVKATRALRQGNPADDDVDVGAVTFAPQVDKVRALLLDAQEHGAVLETGGIPAAGARFMAPTVVTGVTHQMRLMREESFGPVMPLMKVQDEEEGLRLANDCSFGLLGYVFSADAERARQLAERMEAGTVMVNETLSSFALPEAPWSGVKDSGLGRTHSDEGLRDLCQARHVNHEALPLPSRDLWHYPYSRAGLNVLRRLIRLVYGRGAGRFSSR